MRRHYAIGIQGVVVLVLLVILVGWMQALALGGVMAVALTLWAVSSTHSLAHALWHVLSSIAQAGAAVLLL